MNRLIVKTLWNQDLALTFDEAKAWQGRLDKALSEASAALNAYPKLTNGLTPDHIKSTTEWQGNKRACDLAFQRLRQFNARFVKVFKKELAAERKAKRGIPMRNMHDLDKVMGR